MNAVFSRAIVFFCLITTVTLSLSKRSREER